MDYNKIISIQNIHPQVRIANYFTLQTGRNSWGPRRIPDFEMIFIREGRFRYDEHEKTGVSFAYKGRIGGQFQILLEPGDVLLIPPEINHTFSAISGSGAISCIHCLPLDGISWGKGEFYLSPSPAYRTAFSDKMDLMDNLFYKCNDLFSGYHLFRQELLSTVCREIWLNCAARWEVLPNETTVSERMKGMMEFIKVNCTKDVNRKDLAARFSLTPEYVNTLFKQELGMSPTACINKERILLGYSMIHNEGLSVKEAAYRCGFHDPFYFSRVFKKVLGITPETLRGRVYFR